MTMRLDLLALTIAAMAVLPATAQAAENAFIWFEGQPGESTDSRHKGWFDVKQVSLNTENAGTTASASSGAGAGKVTHKEFTITKLVDKASPTLQKAAATGKHFPMVKLEMRKAGGDQHEYLTYTFHDVLISKVNMSGAGSEGPQESITFVYGTMAVQYAKQDDKTAPPKAVPPKVR